MPGKIITFKQLCRDCYHAQDGLGCVHYGRKDIDIEKKPWSVREADLCPIWLALPDGIPETPLTKAAGDLLAACKAAWASHCDTTGCDLSWIGMMQQAIIRAEANPEGVSE